MPYMEKLQHTKFELSKSSENYVSRGNANGIDDLIYVVLCVSPLGCGRSEFKEAINKAVTRAIAIPSVVKDLKALEDQYLVKEKTTSELKKARETSSLHQWCKRVSGNCSKASVVIGSASSCAWKNTRVFFAYMWQLVKAKKTGVCPYMFFDSPAKDPNQNK